MEHNNCFLYFVRRAQCISCHLVFGPCALYVWKLFASCVVCQLCCLPAVFSCTISRSPVRPGCYFGLPPSCSTAITVRFITSFPRSYVQHRLEQRRHEQPTISSIHTVHASRLPLGSAGRTTLAHAHNTHTKHCPSLVRILPAFGT